MQEDCSTLPGRMKEQEAVGRCKEGRRSEARNVDGKRQGDEEGKERGPGVAAAQCHSDRLQDGKAKEQGRGCSEKGEKRDEKSKAVKTEALKKYGGLTEGVDEELEIRGEGASRGEVRAASGTKSGGSEKRDPEGPMDGSRSKKEKLVVSSPSGGAGQPGEDSDGGLPEGVRTKGPPKEAYTALSTMEGFGDLARDFG